MKRILAFILCFALSAQMPYSVSAQKRGNKTSKEPVVGLVLGGGGALGFAHIGVIKALEDAGIKPTVIAGASMGALVGSFYAAGMTTEKMLEMIYQEQLYNADKLFDYQMRSSELGMSTHKAVVALYNKYMPSNSFDSLPKHLAVSVTNLTTGKEEYIQAGGYLRQFCMASMSIPGVFEPVLVYDNYYVDGGTLDNLPAVAIRDRCDVLIGVDVSPLSRSPKLDGLGAVLTRTFEVMTAAGEEPGKKLCDFLISSYASEQYGVFDFSKFEQIYLIGYEAGIEYIREHPEMLTRCGAK